MAKGRKIIILTVVVIIAMIVAFIIPYVAKENRTVELLIPKGASPHKIAKILKDSDVITSQEIFLLLIKFYGYSTKLQAGLYDFNTKDSLNTIINKIKNGESKNIKVTIPEGFNIKQIARVLSEYNICNEQKFISLAKEQSMEGYLFPNTYFLLPQMSEQEVINVMSDEFNKFWTKEKEERLKQINKSKKDIIILASIVEKEAIADTERPIIAGVFLNRLAKGMRLESCSTVLYAMGINKERLSFEDLKFESPYNTYKYKGLPPGPICNPGAKAIDAVLYPQATDSLYFVSKGNGTHYFSSTFEQHVKNKIVSKKRKNV
ncbi:MAG: endolytic transglycosylase MltG [Elusimicrobia bacterium]|nr:endolytic transglycosylase MltG [Elusimicrobiota bacterium]